MPISVTHTFMMYFYDHINHVFQELLDYNPAYLLKQRNIARINKYIHELSTQVSQHYMHDNARA